MAKKNTRQYSFSKWIRNKHQRRLTRQYFIQRRHVSANESDFFKYHHWLKEENNVLITKLKFWKPYMISFHNRCFGCLEGIVEMAYYSQRDGGTVWALMGRMPFEHFIKTHKASQSFWALSLLSYRQIYIYFKW